MQSVSSNAVANALGGYKDTNFNNWISYTMLQALDQTFNATADYRIFQGYTSANTEMGYYGFRHNATKGGVCIVMSRIMVCGVVLVQDCLLLGNIKRLYPFLFSNLD